MNLDSRAAVAMEKTDFPTVARLVDRYGNAVIYRDGVPRYLVLDFNSVGPVETASAEEVREVSRKLMEQYHDAYAALAK